MQLSEISLQLSTVLHIDDYTYHSNHLGSKIKCWPDVWVECQEEKPCYYTSPYCQMCQLQQQQPSIQKHRQPHRVLWTNNPLDFITSLPNCGQFFIKIILIAGTCIKEPDQGRGRAVPVHWRGVGHCWSTSDQQCSLRMAQETASLHCSWWRTFRTSLRTWLLYFVLKCTKPAWLL